MVQNDVQASRAAGRLLKERTPRGVAAAASRRRRDIEKIQQGVVARVIDDFGVTVADLRFGSRGSPQAALARQVAMYLCHTGFALSFETIGRLFGRDRTTVAYACRIIEERRDDIWFDCRIAALEQACGLPLAEESCR
ncbi:MAG: chromosomal replication initiator DnaA [Xanthobacteraceae bacterium]|nr:chromosomal replication initiator DnaA [Xanthobacteraceae bacterium]